jgi:hypothetical protein
MTKGGLGCIQLQVTVSIFPCCLALAGIVPRILVWLILYPEQSFKIIPGDESKK